MTLRLKTRENQRVFVCRELSTDVILHPYYPECYWGWDKVTSWLLFVFHVPSFPATHSSDVTLPWKENWKSILHEHKHTLSAVSFYLQYFFSKPCSPLLKLANTSFLVAKRRSPPPREVFSLPASTMTVLMRPSTGADESRLQHLEHWCFLFFLVTQRTAPPQTPPSPSSQLFLHPWQWRETPGPWLNPGVV